MKNMIRTSLIITAFACCTQSTYTKMVEFIEDFSAVQVPTWLVTKVEHAATIANFNKPYEVAAPTKAGIALNPWNKFVTHGTDPRTQKPLILINTAWFSSLAPAEQEFLLVRAFTAFEQGANPLSTRALPYLYFLFIGIFILLLHTAPLRKYSVATRSAFAFLFVFTCNYLFFNTIQPKLTRYFGAKHDIIINALAVEKTQNKQDAINAFKNLDAAIKSEVKDGEQTFVPHEDVFARYAQTLENSSAQ